MPDAARLGDLLAPHLDGGVVYLALADGLRSLIVDGRLVVGDRLPPQRALAAELGVSRATVVAAFGVLEGEGYLTGRQGSGVTVRLPADRTRRPDERHPAPPVDLDLSIGVVPAPRQVAPAATRAAERLREFLAGHGLHPYGIDPLRSAIAARFTRRGLPTDADQILVTQGALHGWDLVLRAFARPGGHVVVEQPSYPTAIDAVRARRARPVPIAVTAEGRQWPAVPLPPADLAYVVPDFQNPTGHFAGDVERRELVQRLRGPLLCVDETFAELGDADGPVAAPTASFAPGSVTVGSLSKIAWAGVRVGWVRGPREAVDRLAAVRAGQDIAAPVLDQLLALELLDELDTIRDERRAMLQERRQLAVELVRAAGWQVVEPRGGMFLWVDLGGLSSTRLSAAVRERGVRVPPGTRFSITRTHDRFLRLPFTSPPAQLRDAVQRLTDAAADHRVTPRPRDGRVWTV